MTDTILFVHADTQTGPVLAGRLHAFAEGGQENARFEPDKRWARDARARILAPLFDLAPGPYLSGGTLPLLGAMGDSAPDRWGRSLLRHRERRQAREQGREARVLRETDFLAGIDDEVRAGSLRFALRPGGPFLGGAEGKRPIPGLGDLGRIAKAVKRYEKGNARDSQLELLLETGQLLGGSRPKASLRDRDGHLLVAKFASRSDERDMQRWEAMLLAMAGDCGLRIPAWRVARVEGEHVLLLRRFDRAGGGGRRIPFVSMMGLLRARDNKTQSLLQLAEVVRRLGSQPAEDLRELWSRGVFTVLTSNKDNHLRNHGMVLDASGWRLAPAYDMNPEVEKVKPRMLALSLDGVDDRASLEVLLAMGASFGLDQAQARAIALRIGRRVRKWRDYAHALRLGRDEMRKMREAFEHDDLELALKIR